MLRTRKQAGRGRSERPRDSRGHAIAAALVPALLLALCAGCSSRPPPPPEVCVTLTASPNLNLFSEESHVVVAYFFPLRNTTGFEQMDSRELLETLRPPGMTGDAWDTTLHPGDERELRESLPRDTRFVGILADFYKGPRKAIVAAECRRFGQVSAIFSASDVGVR